MNINIFRNLKLEISNFEWIKKYKQTIPQDKGFN